MGICSRRHFLLTICVLQLITTIERQVFDFLGFMWAPILVNFFNIIFVILGFFGAFQYRPKYIISYCVWNTLWLGWNIFIICFYLSVGVLDKDSDILNLGTGSFSWWHVNGPGCKAVYDVMEPELFRPARPTNVTDCVLDYEVIEILHASIQCILGLMAIVGGICLSKVFLEEDDSLRTKRRKKQPRPLYSIEYSQPEPPVQDDSVSPKPMTPRRVKRRSVISRDGTRRSSRRSSVRQSRRKNPVNRIMDHQENLYANTASISQLTNQNVNTLNSQSGSLNYDRISSVGWDRDSRNANWQPEAVNMAVSSPTLWSQDLPNNYSNTSSYPSQLQSSSDWDQAGSSSTRNLTDNWQTSTELSPMQWQGQSNPTFQQTSTQSLNGEDLEELYGNRPASARSSYSNYHGVRATPQVPNRTDVVRQSQRQFVLSGPPAYQDTVI
ncbi:sodium/potassium-transporting ATPase subunit beta-1-interacting protein isoform X1 [Harpegnathos saltator]|uniref:sodium/potassium-transporting ATPase subunit beta-1-interacting protein isoform X1 n=2 Tax=Harpegnathos saltator TaxID=610380 RepID=UPI00058ACAB5|nr:sodium/potassium-transporting ATPase subunit beta-1-interacting protein isoform X1 [Harpegnathos saltator]